MIDEFINSNSFVRAILSICFNILAIFNGEYDLSFSLTRSAFIRSNLLESYLLGMIRSKLFKKYFLPALILKINLKELSSINSANEFSIVAR